MSGRLDHIRESLRNNKILFNTDRLYLEKLLESSFEFKDEEVPQSTLLPLVDKLIDSGAGDYGRLQSIHDALSKGRSLYQSDYNYVQRKLNELSSNTANLITDERTSDHTEETNQKSQRGYDNQRYNAKRLEFKSAYYRRFYTC